MAGAFAVMSSANNLIEQGQHMDNRIANAAQSFSVTVTLSVDDAAALWNAAAERGLAAGMTLGDVLDTIGPREDPAIADCIAMLAAPQPLAGCTLEDFKVREAMIAVAPAQLLELPKAKPEIALRSAANG
jgi:hypothetical protein